MCSLQAAGHLPTGKGILATVPRATVPRATVPPPRTGPHSLEGTAGGRAARGTSAQAAPALTGGKPKERRNNAGRKREEVWRGK